jgi:hypothetical protein
MAEACEKAWETGVPVPGPDSYPVWIKPSKQCLFSVKGKHVYIAPKDQESLEEFIKATPRLTSAEDFEGESGVYTWILYRTRGKALKFAAAKVQSVLELGTLHRALARGTGAVTIHGAGELRKSKPHTQAVELNVQSGSFMVEWKLPASCPLREMGDFVILKALEVLEGLEITIDHPDTFIEDSALPPTAAELAAYEARGLVVCEYDDVASCKKDKAKGCMVKGGKRTRRSPIRRRTTRRIISRS